MPSLRAIYDVVHLLLRELQDFYGERLVSACLFGSVARGTMNNESEIVSLAQSYLKGEVAPGDAANVAGSRRRQAGREVEVTWE